MGCLNSREKSTAEEVVFESAQRINANSAEEKKEDLELQFESILQKIDFPNEEIKKVWKQLPKFVYEKTSDLKMIELHEKDKSTSGETYYGFWDILSDKKEYKGIIVMDDGRVLEGNFAKGEPIGKCRTILANQDVYEGEMNNRVFHGPGRLTRANGTYLEGIWNKGILNGNGVECHLDGSKYEGEFKNGIKSGKGKLMFTDGSAYEGEFENGHSEGKGTFTKPSGERYEGLWKNGLKHGKGVHWFKNDDRYEGDFAYGKKEGFGKFFQRDGQISEGTWVDGMKNGDFVITIPKKGKFLCKFSFGNVSSGASMILANSFLLTSTPPGSGLKSTIKI